jgi:hypothetical protein
MLLSYCLFIPSISFCTAEPIFMKPGTYVMVPEPDSIAYFINSTYPIIAGQRLDKNVTAATNTHATIEELLEALFCLRSVSCSRK